MFSKLKQIAVNSIIGIDFGSNSIKAVALSKRQDSYKVEGFAEALLTKGFIIDGRLEEIDQITTIIKGIRKLFPSKFKHAAIAVTGGDVITKVMTMSRSLNEIELASCVELEAENSIPFPLDEVFIDFEIIGVNADDPLLNDVLVSAARKERVLYQAQCVDDSGLKVVIVDIASHALARAVTLSIDSELYRSGVAILDIGSSQMILNVMHQGDVVFTRTKNHGGAVCSQMISEKYDLSIKEAEKVKIKRNLPFDCDVNVIAPFINMTVNHLRFDLRMFTNSSNHFDIKKLILTGGGALMEGLAQQLSLELEIPVDVANPWLNFEFKNETDKKILMSCAPKYMLALGLALRGVT